MNFLDSEANYEQPPVHGKDIYS
ncbi:uncharacterized protein METZ01_LOCUS67981 [marine metagenome]|uniref:Uncharacterized protein n=1 Tax=marine metagenome TaxID=408172 RepID=A0A381TK19_9ZZZZ